MPVDTPHNLRRITLCGPIALIGFLRVALCLSALLCNGALGQTSVSTSPLPTGVRLDPAGDAVELGSMPLNVVPAPGGDKAVVVLSGWREQGIQIVDLKTRQVTQTLLQDGAFYGAAFSPDGNKLYVSGGNTDMVFSYAWKDGRAALANKFELSKAKTAEGDEPERGFLWSLAKRSGITFRDYGEMVKGNPGWPVTQHDLGADVNPDYVPFDLVTQDQKRADMWIAELQRFVRDGNMPQLELMWLPMDHLAAARPGKCTPYACMADNDLALGRIVQALSHSAYWKDTVIFVVEDDSQAGPDHVDSHRAPFYAISAYNRPGTLHRFINTTDVVAAIEDILGMGRLSKFDYFSRSLADIFASTPDLMPFDAITPKQDLNDKNPQNTAAARMSEGLDLSAPDRVDDLVYNRILWMMLKGNTAWPAVRNRAPLHVLEASRW
jgi:Phosphoesterase family